MCYLAYDGTASIVELSASSASGRNGKPLISVTRISPIADTTKRMTYGPL